MSDVIFCDDCQVQYPVELYPDACPVCTSIAKASLALSFIGQQNITIRELCTLVEAYQGTGVELDYSTATEAAMKIHEEQVERFSEEAPCGD